MTAAFDLQVETHRGVGGIGRAAGVPALYSLIPFRPEFRGLGASFQLGRSGAAVA